MRRREMPARLLRGEMSANKYLAKGIVFAALGAACLASACGGDDLPSDQTGSVSASASAAASSSGAGGMGGAGGEGPECFTDPMTHVEIINACTDAEKVDKVVNLPLLNPDGSLPPLP